MIVINTITITALFYRLTKNCNARCYTFRKACVDMLKVVTHFKQVRVLHAGGIVGKKIDNDIIGVNVLQNKIV